MDYLTLFPSASRNLPRFSALQAEQKLFPLPAGKTSAFPLFILNNHCRYTNFYGSVFCQSCLQVLA